MFRTIIFTISLLLAAALSNRLAAQDRITVYAAASLTDALEEIARVYEKQTGHSLVFSFASSSALARQIEQGAPADIYAAANEIWMDYLQERSLIEPKSRLEFIRNQLALIAPADSASEAVTITKESTLLPLLGSNGWLAVGDPDHVPAGIYAEQALKALGWWTALEPRMARADNTRAALALVERGEAALGIVYVTDAAASDQVKILSVFPDELHSPIRYPFAIVAGRKTSAVQAAFDFFSSDMAADIFTRSSFRVDLP